MVFTEPIHFPIEDLNNMYNSLYGEFMVKMGADLNSCICTPVKQDHTLKMV